MTALTQFLLQSPHPPLNIAEGGIVRIGNSRVSLDTVVECFEEGMSPERIVHSYDTLDLAEVQVAIDFYRAHRADVQAYIHERAADAVALRMRLEAARPPVSREQLLARRAAAEKPSASSGQ
jgi:uncharacterized protein (DUF433 family)